MLMRLFMDGDLDGTRTRNLRADNASLYSIELRGHIQTGPVAGPVTYLDR